MVLISNGSLCGFFALELAPLSHEKGCLDSSICILSFGSLFLQLITLCQKKKKKKTQTNR